MVRFVADFATRAKPLTALKSTMLSKKLPDADENETDAFSELRGRRLAALISTLRRRDGRYGVSVDASY